MDDEHAWSEPDVPTLPGDQPDAAGRDLGLYLEWKVAVPPAGVVTGFDPEMDVVFGDDPSGGHTPFTDPAWDATITALSADTGWLDRRRRTADIGLHVLVEDVTTVTVVAWPPEAPRHLTIALPASGLADPAARAIAFTHALDQLVAAAERLLG